MVGQKYGLEAGDRATASDGSTIRPELGKNMGLTKVCLVVRSHSFFGGFLKRSRKQISRILEGPNLKKIHPQSIFLFQGRFSPCDRGPLGSNPLRKNFCTEFLLQCGIRDIPRGWVCGCIQSKIVVFLLFFLYVTNKGVPTQKKPPPVSCGRLF